MEYLGCRRNPAQTLNICDRSRNLEDSALPDADQKGLNLELESGSRLKS